MIKLFTHTDLDGVGCAILAKLAFKDVDISYCNYDNINEEVKNFITDKNDIDMCFITDVSIEEEIAEYIEEKFSNFYLLDHHSTALYLNKYNWCIVKIENKININTSGTELYYHWLLDNGYLQQSDVLDKFVNLVRDYDTWRWSELGEDGIICKQVNDLMYIYGREVFIEWCLSEIHDNVFPKLYEADKLLLNIKQREIDNYVENKNKQIIFSELCGRKCGFIFAEKYFSELGNRLCKLHPEIDFITMIDMGNRTISYRTDKDDIDLGKDIAQKFGGGGHPKAAGSKFEENILTEILNKAFKKE